MLTDTKPNLHEDAQINGSKEKEPNPIQAREDQNHHENDDYTHTKAENEIRHTSEF